VRRVWPRRLEVTLTEHRAVGVRDDGRLVSDAGVLFVANPEEALVYNRLVEFGGPDDPALARESVRRLGEFGARLAPLGLEIARIEASERGTWALEATSGLRIELGRDEPAGRILERLAAVVEAWPTVVANLRTPPTRIDLRYPNGFAAAGPAVPQLLANAATPARRKP
jgi:cell division protein FtsQ